MNDKSLRRVSVLTGHFNAREVSADAIVVAPCACSTSQTHASATGQPTAYARVHGNVSREPATWISVPSVAKEILTDVKYEKSQGEGIAKVASARPACTPNVN
jgi:hypothetical protein